MYKTSWQPRYEENPHRLTLETAPSVQTRVTDRAVGKREESWTSEIPEHFHPLAHLFIQETFPTDLLFGSLKWNRGNNNKHGGQSMSSGGLEVPLGLTPPTDPTTQTWSHLLRHPLHCRDITVVMIVFCLEVPASQTLLTNSRTYSINTGCPQSPTNPINPRPGSSRPNAVVVGLDDF